MDIENLGEPFEGRNSSVSCFMTRWDLHKESDSCKPLGDMAIEAAQDIPLALRLLQIWIGRVRAVSVKGALYYRSENDQFLERLHALRLWHGL